MKNSEMLHTAHLPEEFLKAFGLEDKGVTKFELILEGDKFAKVKVEFIQSPELVDGIKKIPSIVKNYELIEKI